MCLNVRFFSLGNLKKGKIIVYDREKEEINVIYESFFETPSCLAVSSNDKLLIVGDNKGTITIWSIKTGFCILKFSNHLLAINKVSFFKFFSRLAISASKDGSLKIYDLKKCMVIRTFSCKLKKKNFDSLAVNYSGFFIASSCQKTFKIHIWSLKKGVLIEILNGHESYINKLFFFGKRLKILSSSWDKTFRIWQFENYNKLNYSCICDIFRTKGKILGTCLNPNSKEIAFFVQNDGFLFFNLILKKVVFRIKNSLKKGFKTLNFSENTYKNLAMTYSFNGEKFFFSSSEGPVYYIISSLSLNENVSKRLWNEGFFYQLHFPELNIRKEKSANKFLPDRIIDFIFAKKHEYCFILSSTIFFYSLKFGKITKIKTKPKPFQKERKKLISEKTMKWLFFKKNLYFNFLFIQIFKKLAQIAQKKETQPQKRFIFFKTLRKKIFKKKFFTFPEFTKIFFNCEKNFKKKKNLIEIKILNKKNKILKKLNYLKTKLFFLI